MSDATLDCRVCVVGGGPAGMMAGFLFARAGIKTVVLEKHGDFLRDFGHGIINTHEFHAPGARQLGMDEAQGRALAGGIQRSVEQPGG